MNLCILNNNNNFFTIQSIPDDKIESCFFFLDILFRIAICGSKIWIYNIAVPYAGNQQILKFLVSESAIEVELHNVSFPIFLH